MTEEERILSVCLARLEGMRDFEFWGSAGDLDADLDGSVTDLSIMLLLTDFNRRLYLENKLTQKMCKDLIFACSRRILKMHGRSSSAPRTPLETREFGLVSKFIQWKFCLL